MKQWSFFSLAGLTVCCMGREFHENYAEVSELFAQANDLLGMDIAKLCFEGPEDLLVQTEYVATAITVMNLACLTVLQLHENLSGRRRGHSLGEYSALYAAGVVDLADVLKLVRWRGKFMQQAADSNRAPWLPS